jgi:alpha-galactosidase
VAPSRAALVEKKTVEIPDEQRTRHIFDFDCEETRLALRCEVTCYADFPAVEWVLWFENKGTADTPVLADLRPLDMFVPGMETGFVLHHALGESNSAQSFAPMAAPLKPGTLQPFTLAAKGGRSSDGYMPFFNLQGDGGGMVIAVGWSGQWQADVLYARHDAIEVRAGMPNSRFKLHPGERVRGPRILVLFWQGADPLRGNNLFRRLLIAHYLPRRNGTPVLSPICASVTEVDPDGCYEGPHIRAMEPLAKRGIEVFWSDMDPQQWYPGGFPDGTGTWEPDPVKYPRGLKPVGDAAHAAGLQYLLWFEPERAAKGSRIAREHPEWVTGGEHGGLFKLHLPEARKWLTDYIDTQITAAQLDWVRWDFNIEPLSFWKQNDGPDRQGITEMHHMEGLYAMWDALMKRHPGLVIDVCASGGRRIDLETLTRGLPLWHSDLQCSGKPDPVADQLQNGGLFRWVPMHGCGVFALEPAYAFRSAMTAGNILAVSGARGVLATADPETEGPVRRTVAIYKKLRPYMLGDFYPLLPHSAHETDWYGYQFHRDDLNAGCAIIFRREKCAESGAEVRLRGLDPDADYEVTSEDSAAKHVARGVSLNSLRVEIATAPGAAILYYRKAPDGGAAEKAVIIHE